MKKIIIALALCFYTSCLFSQLIEQYFVTLPERYVPVLSKEKRQLLVSGFKATGADSITNNFKGTSKLEVLDTINDYIKLQLTGLSTFEMKIWNAADSVNRVIGLAHTVCGPVCDSHIAFFQGNLERADEKIFPPIAISDFLNKDKIVAEGKKTDEIVNKYDMLFTTISFNAWDENVIVKSNAKEYLPKEIYEDIEPYIAGDKLIMIWENGTFSKGGVTW